MKIRPICSSIQKKTPKIDFWEERFNAYVLRQQKGPFKNPIPESPSFIKDFLTLIGCLPITRPQTKPISKFGITRQRY